MKKHFSFTGAKKIIFGNGSFDMLGDHIRDMKASRPLVVLDRNLSKTGFKERIARYLWEKWCKGNHFR